MLQKLSLPVFGLFFCLLVSFPSVLAQQEENAASAFEHQLKKRDRVNFLNRFAINLSKNTLFSHRPSGIDFYDGPGRDYLFNVNFPAASEEISQRIMFLIEYAPNSGMSSLYLKGIYYGLEWNFWQALNNHFFLHLVAEFQFFNERIMLEEGYDQTLAVGPCLGILAQIRVTDRFALTTETGFYSAMTTRAEYNMLDQRTSGRLVKWEHQPHRLLSLGLRYYFGEIN